MILKYKLKKLCPKFVVLPVILSLILGVCCFINLKLYEKTKESERNVAWESVPLQNKIFSEIEIVSNLLPPLNITALNFARSMSLFLNGTELTFPAIETKVAPRLFLALSTIPHLSLVSFMGQDGLLFSYYKDNYETRAVFSNASFSSYWYNKPVNRDTGMLYGDAIVSKSPINLNTTWFKGALNNTKGYSSLLTGWDKTLDSLFINTAAIDGRGVLALGFPATVVVDYFQALDFDGGDFQLATATGDVILPTSLRDTEMVIDNNLLLVKTLNSDGSLNDIGNASCAANDWNLRSFHGKIMGVDYRFHCSQIQISGVQLVYVMANPWNRLVGLVHLNSRLSVTLLVLMFVLIIISLGIFIFFIVRAAKREMFLCAALINQTQATQQAERKSMNKTATFAKTSHDVRGSLAVITGLLEACQENVKPQSDLAANLSHIETCTKHLLGILNSVLDISKIEAGKMDLVEEEFNLALLLEEVVDVYHSVGVKKGIDVVLDPCDGSILKLPRVKGDQGKLKQIICNLLSNAVKFTTEGHISVRAVVKKQSFQNYIIASNQNIVSKGLSRLFYKNKECFSDLDALHTAAENAKCLEFEFEVDDTGKGIPKDKQASVFEDYVQVKETAGGLQGCGLGLGIVQSMVRIMGGELRIVDKEPGEKGACFRFTMQLTECKEETDGIEDESARMQSDWSHQHLSFLLNSATRPEGSHVILLIAGEERRRVLRKYIENLNIKVTTLKQGKNLHVELEKLKHRLDGSCLSFSGRRDFMKSSSTNSSPRASEGSKDGVEDVVAQYKKYSVNFTLVVIDGSAGHFYELYSAVAEFKKGIPDFSCKVVWLDNPIERKNRLKCSEESWIIPPCDHVLTKPLHGSRLIQVLQLLPETKAAISNCNLPRLTNELICSGTEPRFSSCHDASVRQTVILENTEKSKKEEPLNGKKILLVEDVDLLRKLTLKNLQKHGAVVESCTNGKDALDHVCQLLKQQKMEGRSDSPLPYDFIIMDCEMPVMNGYEATRLIRMEEKQYDVHIPIIALTAHAMSDKASETIHAGMDFHLTKPMQLDKLLDLFRSRE